MDLVIDLLQGAISADFVQHLCQLGRCTKEANYDNAWALAFKISECQGLAVKDSACVPSLWNQVFHFCPP